MSITPGCIHNQAAMVSPNGLGKTLGAFFEDNIPPTFCAGYRGINFGTTAVVNGRDGNDALKLWLANLALDLTTIDSKITKIRKQFLGSVLGANQIEKRRCIINKGSPALAFDEGWVCQKLYQEGNVGLDAADTELNQSTKHFSADYLIG